MTAPAIASTNSGRAFTPVETGWLTGLSTRTINASIDRGEVTVLRRGRSVKKRVRNLGPADVLYLILRKELGTVLSARAKRELYRRLKDVALEGLSESISAMEEQCDLEIRLAGGVVRIELKEICPRLANRWRALRDATQLVVSDPQIRGGEPVIRGTRVPVYMVADLLKKGAGVNEILEDYPSLDAQMVRAAVAYVETNPRRGRPSKAPWKSLRGAA